MSGLSEGVAQAMEGLGLKAMAVTWRRQEATADRRPPNARVAEALEAERAERASRAAQRRTVRARLPLQSAHLVDLWHDADRGLDPARVDVLGRLSWVRRGASVVLVGATGTGKTWLACALANEAIAAVCSVEVWAIPDLLAEWQRSPEDVPALRRRLARLDLLVLDEWGVEALRESGRQPLRRIVLDRLDRKSLLIVSSRPIARWRRWLGSDLAAASLVDRIESGSQVIEFQGKSLRGRRGLAAAEA